MVFSTAKRRIARLRFTFFLYEVALVFIFIFIILIIPLFSLPLIIDEESILYGILFYVVRAIVIFLGIPLILYLTNLIFESQKKKVILDVDISPSTGHLKLFKVTKKNYKYQILYGFLIFFLLFLPLDFFTFLLVPEMIEYQAGVIVGFPGENFIRSTDIYLLSPDYLIFLLSVIIIQISVSFTEETLARAFLAKRGSEYFFKMSAIMISSLYWGLGHFAYFLNPLSRDYPSWFPFIWFVQAFFIGIILALFVAKKKWILPAIMAHALNNIVSAHTIWSFSQNVNFLTTTFLIYIPLFIIGILFTIVCVLLVWPLSSVKTGLSSGIDMFKTYLKPERIEKTKGDTVFRVFFDIFLAFLIFIMGMLVAI
ncbi:MAG: CPBP family intramembrane glutamic endopeptidase [Promethearchaeota archaeon]|jgi:membrane protease YdiL (CAAX protease family)